MKLMNKGFTLVELLIVVSIIGILATIGIVTFQKSQLRARDGQRKSDLNQISKALELFYSDYGYYPPAAPGGQILACPFNPATRSGTACTWGESEFTDGSTSYFRQLPKDLLYPSQTYFYRLPASSQKFQIFAHLEVEDDVNCIGGNCADPPVNYSCGTNAQCNFAITSSNTTATE